MKWILITILIVIVMIVANEISRQYREKYSFYLNLKQFLNELKINISFKQEKILKFLDSRTAKNQFKLFLDDYKTYLKTNELNLNNLKFLESEELAGLEKIIKDIGKYNSENEIYQIDSFLVLIEGSLLKAKEDQDKLCPMIIKLSLLFSIGLAILLI